MKRGLMLMILLLIPCFGTTAQSDDEENFVVTVYITSKFTEPSQELTDTIQRLTDAIIQRSDNLEGIVIQIENDPEFAYIIVDIDLLTDGILFVDMEPAYLMGVLPSENIVPHMYTEFPLASDTNDPLWVDISVSVVLALSAYFVGDCDAALPYLDEAQELVALQEETFFLGQIAQTDAYLAFYEAMCAIIAEDYALAAQILQDILDVYQQNGFDSTLYGLEVRLNLAWVLFQSGDAPTAFSLISEILGTQFDWIQIDAFLLRSSLYAELGDYEQALADIERANNMIFYDDPNLIFRFAELRIAVGDYFGAEGELTELEKSFPEWTEALFLRGVLAYNEGFSLDALGYFYSYIEIEPYGLFVDDANGYIDSIESGS